MPKLTCQFAAKPSHRINGPGFVSNKKCEILCDCTIEGSEILGTKVERFIIQSQADRGCVQAYISNASEMDPLAFLDRLEIALTTHVGFKGENAFYGTIFIEFDRATLLWQPDATLGEEVKFADTISISVGMTSIERYQVVPADFTTMRHDPLVALYADGLRASTAESKFFHWFIILEEFLERSATLNRKFGPLFSSTEEAAIRGVAGLLNGHKKGKLCEAVHATAKSRAEKLLEILTDLGIKSSEELGRKLELDEDKVAKLIKQRNGLFHKGNKVDQTLLYYTLFPIVTYLARRSSEFFE